MTYTAQSSRFLEWTNWPGQKLLYWRLQRFLHEQRGQIDLWDDEVAQVLRAIEVEFANAVYSPVDASADYDLLAIEDESEGGAG